MQKKKTIKDLNGSTYDSFVFYTLSKKSSWHLKGVIWLVTLFSAIYNPFLKGSTRGHIQKVPHQKEDQFNQSKIVTVLWFVTVLHVNITLTKGLGKRYSPIMNHSKNPLWHICFWECTVDKMLVNKKDCWKKLPLHQSVLKLEFRFPMEGCVILCLVLMLKNKDGQVQKQLVATHWCPHMGGLLTGYKEQIFRKSLKDIHKNFFPQFLSVSVFVSLRNNRR